MHHLHFRYVAEQPRRQSLRSLVQLLDDVPADQRPCLRQLDVFAESTSGKEQVDANYIAFKASLAKLIAAFPSAEDGLVYGLVCYVLGNVQLVRQKAAQAGAEGSNGTRSVSDERDRNNDPVISTFLDQLATHFEATLRQSPHALAARVDDRAVTVSVNRHSEPSKEDPSQPLILRLNMRGLSVVDPAFRRLGLPVNPKYHLDCRMEFSVLPSELPPLSDWTAEWIRGQPDANASAPHIPIELDGEVPGLSTYEPDDPDWRGVDYLWSKAARGVYGKWEQSRAPESEDGESE